MNHPLLENLAALHTTELGAERIRRNLSLGAMDPMVWCREQIAAHSDGIVRRGKNWYVYGDGWVLTVNAGSCTVISGQKIRSTRYEKGHARVLLGSEQGQLLGGGGGF